MIHNRIVGLDQHLQNKLEPLADRSLGKNPMLGSVELRALGQPLESAEQFDRRPTSQPSCDALRTTQLLKSIVS